MQRELEPSAWTEPRKLLAVTQFYTSGLSVCFPECTVSRICVGRVTQAAILTSTYLHSHFKLGNTYYRTNDLLNR